MPLLQLKEREREGNKQTDSLTHAQSLFKNLRTHTHISRCLLYATAEAVCLHTCETPLSATGGGIAVRLHLLFEVMT